MLTLPRSVRDELVARAREGAPHEVCGILAGDRGEVSTVERAVPTENVADAPRVRYAIDPEEQVAVMDDLESADLDVVGFYHSHPEGPERPSATDEARATWAGYSYLIVSLAGAEPTAGCWRWTGERFEEEEIRTV